MSSSLCGTACLAETLTAKFLELEQGHKKWSILETSLTDLVIALFSECGAPNIIVDAPDESKTGADLEFMFVAPIGRHFNAIKVYIQAKRAVYCASRSGYWWYPHLFHPGNSGRQKRQLLRHSNSTGAIPLYCFYHPETAVKSHIHTRGIDLLSAWRVFGQVRKKGDRTNMELTTLQKDFFPFSKLFCDFETSKGLYAFRASLMAKCAFKSGSKIDDNLIGRIGEESVSSIVSWLRDDNRPEQTTRIVVGKQPLDLISSKMRERRDHD